MPTGKGGRPSKADKTYDRKREELNTDFANHWNALVRIKELERQLEEVRRQRNIALDKAGEATSKLEELRRKYNYLVQQSTRAFYVLVQATRLLAEEPELIDRYSGDAGQETYVFVFSKVKLKVVPEASSLTVTAPDKPLDEIPFIVYADGLRADDLLKLRQYAQFAAMTPEERQQLPKKLDNWRFASRHPQPIPRNRHSSSSLPVANMCDIWSQLASTEKEIAVKEFNEPLMHDHPDLYNSTMQEKPTSNWYKPSLKMYDDDYRRNPEMEW